MLRTIFLIAITLVIAIGGGAGSVWFVLNKDFEFDTVQSGTWKAFPARGTSRADPYSKARFSRQADLIPGIAEGVTFTALRDADGASLRSACEYKIEGQLPSARFWTLHVRNAQGNIAMRANGGQSKLHSRTLLHNNDNTVTITVSRHPSPGNWLATDDRGTFRLVLILYDAATASRASINEFKLPSITRTACDV